MPGVSDNIVVRSILGQFLEHSRIMHFGAQDEYWIGSADMMHRNLDRRIEVMVQVRDERLTGELADIFSSALDPRTGAGCCIPTVAGWPPPPRVKRCAIISDR